MKAMNARALNESERVMIQDVARLVNALEGADDYPEVPREMPREVLEVVSELRSRLERELREVISSHIRFKLRRIIGQDLEWQEGELNRFISTDEGKKSVMSQVRAKYMEIGEDLIEPVIQAFKASESGDQDGAEGEGV